MFELSESIEVFALYDNTIYFHLNPRCINALP